MSRDLIAPISRRIVSLHTPFEYFVLSVARFRGRFVGRFKGRLIMETAVDSDGVRYRFSGLAPRDIRGRYDVFALLPGEWIVEPGLVYRVEGK